MTYIKIDDDCADEIVRLNLIETYDLADDYDDDGIKDALFKVIDYYSNPDQFNEFKVKRNIA
jgi:hypothetical protein